MDLLKRVAEYKSIYFRAAWASYATAKKGTLKLIPSARIESEMERDYELMSDMFFRIPPSWKDIMEEILRFETNFNT